jgi:hypothetical protein
MRKNNLTLLCLPAVLIPFSNRSCRSWVGNFGFGLGIPAYKSMGLATHSILLVSCLYSTVKIPGASLASVEVTLTLKNWLQTVCCYSIMLVTILMILHLYIHYAKMVHFSKIGPSVAVQTVSDSRRPLFSIFFFFFSFLFSCCYRHC